MIATHLMIAASSSDTATGVGIPVAIAAGLVSFLSPCVLPLVPGYLSTVIGVAPADIQQAGARRVLVPSLLFIASFSLIFILLGLSATQVGSLLSTHIETLRTAHSNGAPPATNGESAAAAVIIGTVRGVIANPGMQRFLEREGDLALRLLTTKATDFEARLIALIGQLVREEAAAGRLHAAIPADDLPYVLVRIMESYIYLGLITGEHPDPDRAARVISALLPNGIEL